MKTEQLRSNNFGITQSVLSEGMKSRPQDRTRIDEGVLSYLMQQVELPSVDTEDRLLTSAVTTDPVFIELASRLNEAQLQQFWARFKKFATQGDYFIDPVRHKQFRAFRHEDGSLPLIDMATADASSDTDLLFINLRPYKGNQSILVAVYDPADRDEAIAHLEELGYTERKPRDTQILERIEEARTWDTVGLTIS